MDLTTNRFLHRTFLEVTFKGLQQSGEKVK
jgi:hypothetical protein